MDSPRFAYKHVSPEVGEVLSKYELKDIWADLEHLATVGTWRPNVGIPAWAKEVCTLLRLPHVSTMHASMVAYTYIAEALMTM